MPALLRDAALRRGVSRPRRPPSGRRCRLPRGCWRERPPPGAHRIECGRWSIAPVRAIRRTSRHREPAARRLRPGRPSFRPRGQMRRMPPALSPHHRRASIVRPCVAPVVVLAIDAFFHDVLPPLDHRCAASARRPKDCVEFVVSRYCHIEAETDSASRPMRMADRTWPWMRIGRSFSSDMDRRQRAPGCGRHRGTRSRQGPAGRGRAPAGSGDQRRMRAQACARRRATLRLDAVADPQHDTAVTEVGHRSTFALRAPAHWTLRRLGRPMAINTALMLPTR